MAQSRYKAPLKKLPLLLLLELDTFLAMLHRVMTEMVGIEAEAKEGEVKGKHTEK